MKHKTMIHNHGTSDPLPAKVYNHGLKDAAPGKSNCIVNHEILDCSTNDSLEKVLGVHNYSGRALGSTAPGDIIQLPAGLQKQWDWIDKHYTKTGVHHTKNVIWDDNFNLMAEFPTYEPSVFFFGKKAHAARPDKKWFDVVEKLNSKNNFINICKKMKVAVPETWCFDSKSKVGEFSKFPYPCYLKIAVSVSGLGVVRCQDAQVLERELSIIDDDVPFQIQKDVNAFAFLNLQYRKNGKLERFLATEQVLKGCCHAGNAFPTDFQPWHFTDKIAQQMVRNGMKGYFAFDIAACKENGSIKYYAIECNPRYNGISYPSNIAKKINAKKWVAKKISTNKTSLSDFYLGDIEFNKNSGEGVVIVNWGCVTEKEIGVLFVAPSQYRQEVLEEKLQKIVS
ncbi:MAG: ATP-grasp domain-containing protein [bacterium]